MISTTRRSPNATLVSQDAVNQASQALQELPEKPKEKLSLREVVDALRGHITAALDKGYSYEDITSMLAAQGVVIAPSSLKHYLARSNRQAKAKGATTGRRRTSAKTEALEALETEVGSELDALAAETTPNQNGQLNGQPVAPPEAPTEAAPKRGRRGGGQKQDAKPKTTQTSRTKSTTGRRRSSAS